MLWNERVGHEKLITSGLNGISCHCFPGLLTVWGVLNAVVLGSKQIVVLFFATVCQFLDL